MIDADTVAELRRSFAAALAQEDSIEARRHLIAAGWLDVLNEDEQAAIALVFRLQGSMGCGTRALDDVLVLRSGIAEHDETDETAIAYPVMTPTPDGRRVSHVVSPAHRGMRRLVWLHDVRGEHVEIIDVEGTLDTTPIHGIDPAFGLWRTRTSALRPVGSDE